MNNRGNCGICNTCMVDKTRTVHKRASKKGGTQWYTKIHCKPMLEWIIKMYLFHAFSLLSRLSTLFELLTPFYEQCVNDIHTFPHQIISKSDGKWRRVGGGKSTHFFLFSIYKPVSLTTWAYSVKISKLFNHY